MVYDLLITREHFKITWAVEEKRAAITLLTPDPIPPLHLTCKFLAEEAGNYLAGRVARMGVRHRVPKMIIHPDEFLAFDDIEALYELMFNISDYRYEGRRQSYYHDTLDFLVVTESSSPSLEGVLHALNQYVVRVASLTPRVAGDPGEMNWGNETWHEIKSKLSYSEIQSLWDKNADRQALIQERTQQLMDAPNSKSRELHILILGEAKVKDSAGNLHLLKGLASLCYSAMIRAYVHTSRQRDGNVEFRDEDG